MNSYKSLFKICLPVLVEQSLIVLMGIINVMLTSNISSKAVAAVGMVDSFGFIVIALFSALTTGGTVIVAQYVGQNNIFKANETVRQALFSAFIISLVLSAAVFAFKEPLLRLMFGKAEQEVLKLAVQYLGIIIISYPLLAVFQTAYGVMRGSGDVKTPMFQAPVMNIANLIFSYILIYGIHLRIFGIKIETPSFGVPGAAVGLTLARLLGVVMSLWSLLKGGKVIRLERSKFSIDFDLQKKILFIGVPSSAESSIFNVGKLITQTFIVAAGTAAIAANTIAGSITNLLNVAGQAFSVAVMTLVGQATGRQDYASAKKNMNMTVLLSSGILLAACLIMLPFTRFIISLYHQDSGTADVTTLLLYGNYIAMPLFWSTSFVLPCGLRAAGDVKYPMIVSIISMWTVRVMLGYV